MFCLVPLAEKADSAARGRQTAQHGQRRATAERGLSSGNYNAADEEEEEEDTTCDAAVVVARTSHLSLPRPIPRCEDCHPPLR